jgi:hypothetical protein
VALAIEQSLIGYALVVLASAKEQTARAISEEAIDQPGCRELFTTKIVCKI